MKRFESDYLEGAHPDVLRRIAETNTLQTPGYGEDEFCGRARGLILERCGLPDGYVQFLVGGTQVNRTVIASQLRPHQGVIAADCGHIAVHETGAIENSGHKVLTVPAVNGKVAADAVEKLCRAHWTDSSFEHAVQPGMVFISNPSEYGTVYSRSELEALYGVCRTWNLPLYIDGARLGCALHCADCDYSLAEMAQLCDIFTIGGTKMGALFGEAAVFRDKALAKDFRYMIKQNGGMFAKGRLLGLQYLALFEDGLYDRIAEEEVRLALRLRDGFRARGWDFLVESPTNQQFPILPDTLIEALSSEFTCSHIQSLPGGRSAVRFCTSWATTDADIDALLSAVPQNRA